MSFFAKIIAKIFAYTLRATIRSLAKDAIKVDEQATSLDSWENMLKITDDHKKQLAEVAKTELDAKKTISDMKAQRVALIASEQAAKKDLADKVVAMKQHASELRAKKDKLSELL